MKKIFILMFFVGLSVLGRSQCPVAAFNSLPVKGCAIPHTVFFTDQSTSPDTWLWDFGDGNTSTLQNPVHNYTTTGSFTVVLTVTDTISGCSDQFFEEISISIPAADFSGAPLFGCGPLNTNFTDASSVAGSSITSWSWDFGDGSTSSLQNPSHVFNKPGLYTISLTVTDTNGCSDTRTRTNYIQVIGPDVNFGADAIEGCDPLQVNFTDSTIFLAPITSWLWDFGDGNNSSFQNPSHMYTNPGNLDVSLTVTDIDGCNRTFVRTQYIKVNSETYGTDVQTACDSYLWTDGNTYTTSNTTALDTFVNAVGCDSIVTLNLTIINSTYGTDVQTACDSYLWTDGNTYTTNNTTALDTFVNYLGCDSIVTLNLTIVNSDTANAGTDTNICVGITSWNLSGNAPISGSGMWTSLGSATVDFPTQNNSSVSGLVNGSNEFVWTITNSPCNTTRDTVNIIVEDTVLPLIACPANQNVYFDNNCEFVLADYTALALTNDNCSSSIAVSQNPISGTIITATQTIVLIADDGNGNKDSCQFSVIPSDTISPVITCPGNQNVFYDGSCQYTLLDYTGLATANDNCGSLLITQTPLPGTILSANQTVVLTVTDSSGNRDSCMFDVVPGDTISPTITCPGNQNVFYNGSCEYTLLDYTGTAISSDNCGSVTVIQNPVAGTVLDTNQMITLIAVDGAGNIDSCTFEIIPLDTITPTITCPGNQNVFYDGSCQYTLLDYTALVVANDNCGTVSVNQVPVAGTPITSTQTVVLTVTDGSGNKDSCQFNVIPSDTTSPVITCPSNQNVFYDGSCQYTLLDYTGLAITNDNCDSLSISQNPLPGTILSANQTVILTVTDSSGNKDSCLFDVIPGDTTSPVITCPGDQIVYYSTSCDYMLVDYTGLAVTSDNCSSSITVTQTPVVGTLLSLNQTVTLTADDGNGNISSCSFEVLPQDTIAPVMSCLSDTASCFPIINFAIPVAVENCGTATVTQIAGLPPGSVFPVGVTTITFEAQDTSGNVTSCSFDITIHEKPIASATSVNVNCFGGNDGSIDVTVNNGLSPYTFSWSNSATTEDVNTLSAGTYAVIVTDGNTCKDTVDMTINEPPPLVVSKTIINNGCYGISEGSIDITVSGGVSPYRYNWDMGDTTTIVLGLLAGNYTVTVTDSHNCVISETYTVQQPNEFVLDVVLSEFFQYNVSEHGACDGTIDLTVFGGFEPYQYTWSSSDTTKDINGLCAGTYTVVVTDLDQCTATGSFILTEPEPVVVPEGFSPNNDGINDFFIIEGLDVYPDNSIEVFNRWGNITYKASPYQNDWDGTSDYAVIGKKVPDGSYFYKLKLKGDKQPIVGYIVIKR